MNKPSASLPANLRLFIDNEKWTYAKTMPQWPHEYTVRGQVDANLFEQLARHIRANGYARAFYQETLVYYEEGGMLYWTMGTPISEATIINRCRRESSYESRLRNGTLP